MKPENRKLPMWDFQYDSVSTSEYHAIYKKGEFIDATTDKPIQLKETARVILKVPNMYIMDEDIAQHSKVQIKQVFKPGQEFYFDIKLPNGNRYRFFIKSKYAIIAVKKGNKKTTFKNSACTIFKAVDLHLNHQISQFEKEDAISLNNAFTIMSEKYRLGKAAHTVDVYKDFYTKEGKLLDNIRDSIF